MNIFENEFENMKINFIKNWKYSEFMVLSRRQIILLGQCY